MEEPSRLVRSICCCPPKPPRRSTSPASRRQSASAMASGINGNEPACSRGVWPKPKCRSSLCFGKKIESLAKKCASEGAWDTHGNNFNCLKENLLPEFDRGFSALIEDLADRGLLDQTLLLVTSEMGRTPKIGDPVPAAPAGRGAITGRIARACSWPAAASAAVRYLARPIALGNMLPISR